MFNILTYVRVAPATEDVHIILEVLATDKIHIEDRGKISVYPHTFIMHTVLCLTKQ